MISLEVFERFSNLAYPLVDLLRLAAFGEGFDAEC
jgi:hypothetical protein